MDVVIKQAKHLRLLKRTHAPIRAGHEHAYAFFTTHRILCRTSRIATGGAEYIEFLAPPRQFVFKQIAQQLHGHVFESQRRAVGQRLQVQALFKALQRHNRFGAKDLRGISFATQSAQISLRNIVHIQRQNFKSQVCIRQGAPTHQGLATDLRIVSRQVQTAIRR